MAVAQAQRARSLPRTRLPDQLHIIFIHLAKPRCADRLPAGEAPAIGVDRQAAVDPRAALGDPCGLLAIGAEPVFRSEEHTSELQSLMRISYAVFCLKKTTLLSPPIYSQI